MAMIDDLHPDAVWCSSQRQETMKSTGLKVEAESQDLRNIEALVLDPEELIMELEAWNVVKEPPPEHTMDMWNYVNPETAQAKADAKEAKKAAAAVNRAAKAAFKKANKPPPKSKAAKSKKKAKAKTTKKGRSLPEFPGFPAYYPPAGHLIDFNWGDGWYEGKFLKMEVDAEGDELCHLEDTASNDVHKVLLRERENDEDEWTESLEWVPLFYCNHCKKATPGHVVCFECSMPNNGDEDWDSDESDSD